MTHIKYYLKDDVLEGRADIEFKNNSVIKIKNLFDKAFCDEVLDFIKNNEQMIINRYKDNNRALVLDNFESNKLIKYFEHPFSYNRNLFGKFSNSQVYKIAECLLKEEVYLFSMEIHSRIAMGTSIPPHQDNAYYGLEKGRALTFYVPLNSQHYLEGGLRYLKNNILKEFEHDSSSEKGFSLTVKNKNDIKLLEKLDPIYEPGDCSIHHSSSIHYAESVPPNTKRGLVLRMSFFAIKEKQKINHLKWYEKIVEKNRLENLQE